jgi:thiamine pyrophosphokinase
MEIIQFNKRADTDVRATLEEALNTGFDSVFVLGFRGNDVNVLFSGTRNEFEVVGALELAKFSLQRKGWTS